MLKNRLKLRKKTDRIKYNLKLITLMECRIEYFQGLHIYFIHTYTVVAWIVLSQKYESCLNQLSKKKHFVDIHSVLWHHQSSFLSKLSSILCNIK